jgi:N6-adenosine-specific RNA methylase IME4
MREFHPLTDALLPFHPLADIFPLIEGEDFQALVADIRQHGLHEPIVLLEDKILDGRNRYRACIAAGVDPIFVPYRGDDPVSFVISFNLRRRHLDESQRAMVAAKLATLRRGDNQHTEGLPIGRSSDLLNVGERSVARAREVIDRGTPELQRAVERGDVSVSVAADISDLAPDDQREIVARGEREILDAAKNIRTQRAMQRHAERVGKILEASKNNRPLQSGCSYPVICADPPWHFQNYGEPTGLHGAAADHYPTMATVDICALPVRDLATADAVLLLWTTNPHLPDALQVIEAWNFEYKTNIAWMKDKAGLGFIVRGQHELLLIATRGNFPAPLPAARPPSVLIASRREHSRKPDEAYALIERMYPGLPKVELFARQARPGWDVWGNETGKYDAAADVEGSFSEAYAAIRERQAKGGPGWNPK